MELLPLLDNARQFLRQGETGQALDLLLEFFSRNRKEYAELLRTLDVIAGGYNSARQRNLKGVLTNAEMELQTNKTNEALVALIDALADGKMPVVERTRTYSRRIWWIGAAALVLLSLVVAWLAFRTPDSCPDWESNDLRIMILPFRALSLESARPALQIRDSIEKITEKNKFPVEVRIAAVPSKPDTDHGNAAKLGRTCKADLVIWGTYLAWANDSIRVRTGYVFTGGDKQKGLGSFRDFADVSEVGPDRSLEDAIFSVCAMIALKEKRNGLAKKWLKKIEAPNAEEESMLSMLEGQ